VNRAWIAIAGVPAGGMLGGASRRDYFQIKVMDESTGRGVPLVELVALNAVRYYTDSSGVIAFGEPHLMGRSIFFEIHGHGYRAPKAPGSDLGGAVLKPARGGKAEVRIHRINIAERLYRLTGEGIYRDSAILGLPVPIQDPLLSGGVTGTDGASTAIYRGKLYWFFGDTNGLNNLNFGGAVATSDLPSRGGLNPSAGVNLKYFVDASGFSKAMLPNSGGGLVWPFAPMTHALHSARCSPKAISEPAIPSFRNF
jgi:hypothetical protein